jgi:pre-60S factor REI1
MHSLNFSSKTFRSDAQYEQHVQSKKHKLAEAEYVEDVAPRKPAATSQQQPKVGSAAQTEAVFGDAGMEEDGDAEDDQEDESAALPVTACLFCSHQSESLEQNVAHMTEVHSFFVPYVEYLQDLSGFIEYLGYKVGMGRVCIYCNGRGRARFPSVSALQQHMISKGHCKVRFEDEDEEEMHEFYDFTLDLSMEEASSSTALVTRHASLFLWVGYLVELIC